MGGLLAIAAGTGMFCLIAALIGSFLTQVCKIPLPNARRMRSGIIIGVGFFLLQWLAAGMLRAVMYGDAPMMDFSALFNTWYIQEMIIGLQEPSMITGWLNRAIASMGHAAGSVLFGQYVQGGFVLSVAAGCLSCCLLLRAFSRRSDEKSARNTLCVILSCPGMVFAFLPGWVPLAFMLLSALICLFSRSRSAHPLPAALTAPLLSVGGILSAGLLFAMAVGQLG